MMTRGPMLLDDWDLHDTDVDENLECAILHDQELERARMLCRESLGIAEPVIERGCWVEHDVEEVVVWVFKNGDVLVRHLHGERWLLGVAPLSELSYLRPADAVSEHVLTLQGQWGKSDGPVELTWLEVQAGMERAERCVAKWPKWKRDLQ